MVVICVILVLASLRVRKAMLEVDLQNRLQLERNAVVLEAGGIRYRLEAELNSAFYLVTSLATYIKTNPDLTEEEFQRFAASMHRLKPNIINVAAAPDMVVRYVYPVLGNEAVIGLNYSKMPSQREAAYAVKESGKPVIAGPIDLVQGGKAVIGRFPVFTDDGFWGIVSTPYGFEDLLENAGVLDKELDIEIALRGKDGKGTDGAVFFGSEDVFGEDSVCIPISFPFGSWEMGVQPKNGWVAAAPNRVLIDFAVFTVELLLLVLILLLNIYVLSLLKSKEVESEVSRAKSRFLATMSHEVRTPLNAIYGVAQLLDDTDLDADQRELNSIVVDSSAALGDLLSDILNLSQLESGQFTVREERIQVESIVDPIVKLLEKEAEKKGVELDYAGIPEKLDFVLLDPLVLRQVLWNLLSNAVKFTEKGSIQFMLEHAKGGWGNRDLLRIKVKDTGIGIHKSRQAAIFDDFVQEDDSTTRRHGGTGLGLAIVRRLVEASKGSIQLNSEKGRGSEFTVDLPINF